MRGAADEWLPQCTLQSLRGINLTRSYFILQDLEKTHVGFADSRTTMQQKDLPVAFILNEVCGPGLRQFAPRTSAPQRIDRRDICDSVSVDERLDHSLSVFAHNKIVDGVVVEHDLLATGNIYQY